jgi:hypothetical protein
VLKNLDKRVREETSLVRSPNPLSSIVLSAGKMLSDFDLLRRISLTEGIAEIAGLRDLGITEGR